MNTFEKYFAEFPAFLSTILTWRPDYLVPVARKACKLIKTVELNTPGLDSDTKLRYRTFFQLSGATLRGKKVAVIDDASQYTSGLSDYRDFFERQGAIVRTFSFVGHEDLSTGKRLKEDHFAEIAKFLPNAVYNEYILQQSYHLLSSGCHFDLDHIIFELPLSATKYAELLDSLVVKGTLLFIPDDTRESHIQRFSLHYPDFFNRIPFFSSTNIALGPIIKLKFAYDLKSAKLFISPIIFPEWQYGATSNTSSLLADVPFRLPFASQDRLDRKNWASILRVYNNLSFVASISLAKAFFDTVVTGLNLTRRATLVATDLAASLGSKEAASLATSVETFISGPRFPNFSGEVKARGTVGRRPRHTFASFAEIYDKLRNGYADKVAARTRRAGLHYLLSYKTLFRAVSDRIELSHLLDYFCDLGAIVPGTIVKNGWVLRGCRTGEANPEQSCARTDAIIGLAVNLICEALKCNSVDATLLNKVLATFAFDYPKEDYTQLHCLEATPYFYGSFMKARHPLRWPDSKPLYSLGKSAEYFEWNERRRTFVPKNKKKLTQEVLTLFDQRQQAGYTELHNYLKMLAAIARRSTSVDVMNLLSICRDQDVFYAHVDFNIREAFSLTLEHYHSHSTVATEALENALNNAESAATKCKLANEAPRLIAEIFDHYSTTLDYAHAATRIRDHYSPFDVDFANRLTHLKVIVRTEILLIHLLQWKIKQEHKFFELLVQFGIDDELARRGKTISPRAEVLQSDIEQADLISGLMQQLTQMLYSLPKPKDTFRSRHINSAKESARNQAIHFVAENKFTDGLFLHIDLSGMRQLDTVTSLEEVLAHFFLLVKEQATNTGGRILYGGNSSDDAFDIFFGETAQALRCVEEIKEGFEQNIFLSSNERDVKFGMVWGDFSTGSIPRAINTAWGNAKECCCFKSDSFANRGDLLISAETYKGLQEKLGSESAIVASFVELPLAKLPSGLPLYRYTKIRPITR